MAQPPMHVRSNPAGAASHPGLLLLVLLNAVLAAAAHAQSAAPGTMRFECRSSAASTQAIPLTAASLFSPVAEPGPRAFGFDLKTVPETFAGGGCESGTPFFFSVAVPDGNYRVTVTLGGKTASTTTLRAESRRLLLMEKKVAPGATATEEFVLNVRTPFIGDSGTQVRLKPREIGALDWDDRLTLEFNGEHPALRSLTVTPVSDVPTLYLAGDSTVVDQDKEPWAAWGQMLPLFFGPGLAIANHAESGETIKSFVGERRLEKIMSTLKKGDFLAMQFAHNDQKPGAGYVPAATDYKTFLKSFISQARARGATPILVTSMNRRTFGPDGRIRDTLGEYAAAMREVSVEENVALIDLNALSKTLYEAMGEAGTLHAFVHYPANAFPGQTEELKDDTHFNSYGAYELARCVVREIQLQHLPLARYLRRAIPPFEPAHPDPLSEWRLPASPAISIDTPYQR